MLLLALTGSFRVPGAFDRWELIQAQELHSKLRLKQHVQRLHSEVGDIAAWLEKTEAELGALKQAAPPSDTQEMALRVKRLRVSGSCGWKGEESRAGSALLCWANKSGLGLE